MQIEKWAKLQNIKGQLVLAFMTDDDEGRDAVKIITKKDHELGIEERSTTLSMVEDGEFTQENFDHLTSEEQILKHYGDWFDD